MRTVAQSILDAAAQPKTVNARVTFRKKLPVFSTVGLTDSLGLTDPAQIDACAYDTGILRVVNRNNVLYTQYISDVGNPWPAWTNRSINLYPGSVPAVDAGYVWYQDSTGQVYYRYYGTWNSPQSIRNMPGALALAPLGARAYALWVRNTGAFEIVSLNGQESSQYTIFGPTSMPRIDVVTLNGKEYFYTMDRDEGRIIEIQHTGNAVSGKDSYGVGKAIIPIDAIDTDYGLKMGYANVINGKVVVTGRLTRTSDDTPVSMDVYCIGPEYFSLGREMFIQADYNINGKLLLVGSKLVVPGAQRYMIADATSLFGYDSASLKLQTSDLASVTLQEAEGRSSVIDLDLSTDISHAAVAAGSEATLEMAYDDTWCTLATGDVDEIQRNESEAGASFGIRAVGQSAKRLNAWAPEQGVYIPSMAAMWDNPSSLTHVIRGSGKWEPVTEGDPTSPIKLADINKNCFLYSASRASRGGAMRGKFYLPSDTTFKAYWGVAINYYRETAAEAAERLGVEVNSLTDSQYGHSGIVAYQDPFNSKLVLCHLVNNTWNTLTQVSHSIPTDTWHWLQIEFVEGEIRVKYRLDTNATWTEVIAFLYNRSTLPWKRETLGRGAIYAYNWMPSTNCWGLSSDDDTLAVADNSIFPASGTVLVDNEQITYSAKSANTALNDYQARYASEVMDPDASFTSGTRVVITGTLSGVDNTYNNLAAAVVQEDPFTGQINSCFRTLRIVGYDAVCPRFWQPTAGIFFYGWINYIGNTSYGYWYVPGAGDIYHAFYLSPNPYTTIVLNQMDDSPGYRLAIKPALHLSGRGAGGTTAASHNSGTAHLYTSKSVQCAVAASFSQDEDQSLEDALKTIVGLAGGKASCQALADEAHNFAAAGVVAVTNDHKNFIATFDVPALNASTGVGIAFRGAAPFTYVNGLPFSANDGSYYLEVERISNAYYLTLYDRYVNDDYNIIERVPIRPANLNGAATANVPAGTIKVSVQDNLFSVWLNGRYLHTFHSDLYPEGIFAAFVSRLAASFRIHLSELDDLLADIVVGTRGNGMSVLSELLADRHVLFRDQQDGSLFFYKSRRHIGTIPDLISAVSSVEADSLVTRLRAEGLKISEIADLELLRQSGNLFATVNARFANTVAETSKEAQFLIDEAWRNSQTKKYAMVPYPALQPGDAATFSDGASSDMIVRAQTISIGLSGTNLICDMEAHVAPYERP